MVVFIANLQCLFGGTWPEAVPLVQEQEHTFYKANFCNSDLNFFVVFDVCVDLEPLHVPPVNGAALSWQAVCVCACVCVRVDMGTCIDI